jgi:transcriptional regulator of acetoin/glycerol metabolism
LADVLSDCAADRAESTRRLGISRDTLYGRLRQSRPAGRAESS